MEVFCEAVDARGVEWKGAYDEWAEQPCFQDQEDEEQGGVAR